MGRLSALAAAAAVAALVAMYVACYEPERRAANRASAVAADVEAPVGKAAPRVVLQPGGTIVGDPAPDLARPCTVVGRDDRRAPGLAPTRA